MPTRLLREGILDSERVNSLSVQGEIFYRRLMSVVDDYGRFDGRIPIIRCRLYSLQLDRVSEDDVAHWINECVHLGLISHYTVGGKPYLFYHNLGSPRSKRAKYPAPPSNIDRSDPAEHESDSDESPTSKQANTEQCTNENQPVHTCAPDDTHLRTDRSASVPYSGSGSGSSSNTEEEPPKAPQGGADRIRQPGDKPSRKRKTRESPESVPIPPELDTPAFRDKFAEFIRYRREVKRRPMSAEAARKSLDRCREVGVTEAIEAIDIAISCDWQGVFPKPGSTGPPARQDRPQRLTDDERIRAAEERFNALLNPQQETDSSA